MAKYYIDPATGQRIEVKKTHKFRNFVVLPAVGLVGLIVVLAAVSGGSNAPTGGSPAVPAVVEGTPAEAPQGSRLEVFGDGEAMLSVMTDGMVSNTVQLPHSQDLQEGYVSVSVTRSPSVESYMQNGGPDSGSVGCRIIRDGETIDEKVASGEFASVTCSKFM